MKILLLLRVLPICIILRCTFCNDTSTYPNRLEYCRQKYRSDLANGAIFEQFPTGLGIGWDNLQNLPRSNILNVTFQSCSLTPDLQYLVPDNIDVIAVKQSNIDRLAKLYKSYQSYFESEGYSVNYGASAGIEHFSISGSYSAEMQSAKQYSLGKDSSILRTEIEYHGYTAISDPYATFHQAFKNRLLEVGHALLKNHTKLAMYLSQLIIRDYGTHVITNVDVGMKIFQQDYADSSQMSQSSTDSTDMRAAASASFFGVVGVSVSAGRQTNQTTFQKYQSMLTHTQYHARGGPVIDDLLRNGGFANSTKNELIILDRNGEPLFMLVNEDVLPELPLPTVIRVQQFLKNATDEYYKRNTIYGCLEPDAENFNYNANVNDTTCKTPYNNYTFGGLYQTCSPADYDTPDWRCKDFSLKNSLNNQFACPVDLGFEAVKLLDTVHAFAPRKESISTQTCRSCGFLWLKECCTTNTYEQLYIDHIRLEAYWCYAKVQTHLDTGYLFGGLYTKKMANPFSANGQNCPGKFVANKIGVDLHVCLSRDYELDYHSSVNFGGFFSCKDTNQHCPTGYTQHLAEIVDSCEIYYCVRHGSFSYKNQMRAIMPPFMDFPYEYEAFTIMQGYKDGRLWSTPSVGNGTWSMSRIMQKDGSLPDDQLLLDAWTKMQNQQAWSPGQIAGTTVGCFALLVICILASVWIMKRKSSMQRQNGYEPITSVEST